MLSNNIKQIKLKSPLLSFKFETTNCKINVSPFVSHKNVVDASGKVEILISLSLKIAYRRKNPKNFLNVFDSQIPNSSALAALTGCSQNQEKLLGKLRFNMLATPQVIAIKFPISRLLSPNESRLYLSLSTLMSH